MLSLPLPQSSDSSSLCFCGDVGVTLEYQERGRKLARLADPLLGLAPCFSVRAFCDALELDQGEVLAYWSREEADEVWPGQGEMVWVVIITRDYLRAYLRVRNGVHYDHGCVHEVRFGSEPFGQSREVFRSELAARQRYQLLITLPWCTNGGIVPVDDVCGMF